MLWEKKNVERKELKCLGRKQKPYSLIYRRTSNRLLQEVKNCLNLHFVPKLVRFKSNVCQAVRRL